MDFLFGLLRPLAIVMCAISAIGLLLRLWYTRGKQHYLLRATFAVLNTAAVFYFCSHAFTDRYDDIGLFILAVLAVIGDCIVGARFGGVRMDMLLAPPKPRVADERAPIADVGVWPPSVQREKTTQSDEHYFEHVRRDLVMMAKRAAGIFLIVLIAGSAMIAGTFIFPYASSGLGPSTLSSRAFWIGLISSKTFLIVLAGFAVFVFALVLVLYILPKATALLAPPIVRAWKNRYETLRLAKANGTSLERPAD